MRTKVSGVRCQVSGWEARRSPFHVSRFTHHAACAFTLVEVMVALLIFFMAVFTVLGLLSNSLRNARLLQRKTVDAGMVAAQSFYQLSNTNQVAEGEDVGDFGEAYPDHEWTTVTYEAATNGLYQVDIVVQRQQTGAVESKMAILMFSPNSRGSLSRGGLPQ